LTANFVSSTVDSGGDDEGPHKGDVMENLKRFLAIAAVITVINGIGYTLAPGVLLPNYGILPDAGAALGFRFLGAALLTFGLILWFVRQSHDWIAIRAVLIGAAVGNIVGIVVSLRATLTGVMNGSGWLFVVTYAVLLLGYAYSLYAGSRKFGAG
jgi:xanthine/uracil permease